MILNMHNLQLYGIKHSYQIQIMFKYIYLTHRLGVTCTTTKGHGGPGSNSYEMLIKIFITEAWKHVTF